MVQSVIVVVRVVLGLLIGLVGLAALLRGLAMPAFRDFVLFGWPGANLVLCVVVGVALLYASARLLVRTLKLRPQTV